MVQFNPENREIAVKVVYYGPALSGKTTNLQALYQKIDPKVRGRLMTLDTKDDRTLFFDMMPVFFKTQAGVRVKLDSREEMITSHVMDLEQVLELGGAGSVRRGGLENLLDAQVVVLTASTPLAVNSSRLEYLTANADVLAGVVDVLEQNAAWPGVLIVVTNPVDPLCTWIERRTGIDRARVLGYTLNDSLRLRTGIARVLGVGPGAVEAWVVGEHGDACVPLFDRVRVAGEAIELSPEQRTEADGFLRTWYVRHVALDSGRSSTWTSGVGVARMVSAIAADERELWPASIVLRGEYGVEGVALSVPTLLGRDGAAIEEWALAPDDQAAFELAAVRVGEAARRIEARRAGSVLRC
jgi:malate/lactate dehydrogenase